MSDPTCDDKQCLSFVPGPGNSWMQQVLVIGGGNGTQDQAVLECLEDANGLFWRLYVLDPTTATIVNQNDFDEDGNPYVPVPPVTKPDFSEIDDPDNTGQILCLQDDNQIFLRVYIINPTTGALVLKADFDLACNPYVPVGTVHKPDEEVTVLNDEMASLQCLQDDNGLFWRLYKLDPDTGTIISFNDYDVAGAVYVPVGTVHKPEGLLGVPPEKDVVTHCLEDDNGTFLRFFVTDAATGGIDSQSDYTLNGAPYVPVGVVSKPRVELVEPGRTSFFECLQDDNGLFFRLYIVNNETAAIESQTDITVNGTPYVTVGTVSKGTAGATSDNKAIWECLEDDVGLFFRLYLIDATDGSISGQFNYTVSGAPYIPVGTVKKGNAVKEEDAMLECMRDNNGLFFRAYKVNNKTGAVTPLADVDVDGLAYVPVGPVEKGVPTPELDDKLDAVWECLTDNNGDFFRLYVINTANSTIASIANFTIAGAPYVPVGTVTKPPSGGVDEDDQTAQLKCLEDDNGTFWRLYVLDPDTATITAQDDFNIDGSPRGATVGVVKKACVCPMDNDPEIECLQDDNGLFFRSYILDPLTGAVISTADFDVDGTPWIVSGTVTKATVQTNADTKTAILECLKDDNGLFYRSYVVDTTTNLVDSTQDLDIAGANYVPVGTVEKATPPVYGPDIICETLQISGVWNVPANTLSATIIVTNNGVDINGVSFNRGSYSFSAIGGCQFITSLTVDEASGAGQIIWTRY